MRRTSKNLKSDEQIENSAPMTTQVSTPGSEKSAGVKFGDCMFGRHEYCKKVLEGGRVCPCDCGEKHGVSYKPVDLNTPIHVLTMKVVEAHKKGERYSVDAAAEDGDVAPVIELSYRASEPLPKVEHHEDTLAELEAKRK